MLDMALRSLELFFRDRVSVIMALFAEIIIMVLYILFMRDNLLETFAEIDRTGEITDTWMLAGILGITPLTASMSAYAVMIEDKSRKRNMDIGISPLGKTSIALGYITGAALAGVIMSAAVFFISEIYVFIRYDSIAGAGNIAAIYVLILINSLCCAVIVMLPVSFLRSCTALAGCCTILGALIGFMTGIYLPVGSLSDSVALLIKLFPISHGVVPFRALMTEPTISKAMDLESEAAQEFTEYMGIRLTWQESALCYETDVLVLLGFAALCLALILIKPLLRQR